MPSLGSTPNLLYESASRALLGRMCRSFSTPGLEIRPVERPARSVIDADSQRLQKGKVAGMPARFRWSIGRLTSGDRPGYVVRESLRVIGCPACREARTAIFGRGKKRRQEHG